MPTPLRELIFAAVTGDAPINNLIGVRCYPERLPQGCEFPAISYIAHVSQDDSTYRTHDTGTVGRCVSRAQFNCYAETDDGADELARAVIDLWSGYQDLCDIGYAQIANRVDTREDALNRYRHIVDVLIEHER